MTQYNHKGTYPAAPHSEGFEKYFTEKQAFSIRWALPLIALLLLLLLAASYFIRVPQIINERGIFIGSYNDSSGQQIITVSAITRNEPGYETMIGQEVKMECFDQQQNKVISSKGEIYKIDTAGKDKEIVLYIYPADNKMTKELYNRAVEDKWQVQLHIISGRKRLLKYLSYF